MNVGRQARTHAKYDAASGWHLLAMSMEPGGDGPWYELAQLHQREQM